MMISLINATAERIPLAEKSIHVVCTSPPYWSHRDYGLAPRVYGGLPTCLHTWGTEQFPGNYNYEDKIRSGQWDGGKQKAVAETRSRFCRFCDAWRGSLGLEPTPEMYVEHIVEVFREVKRVLRDDGTVWLNLGDSYAGSAQGWSKDKIYAGPKRQTNRGSIDRTWLEDYGYSRPPGYISSRQPSGLKPKDLVGIPWRCALALQADGWHLRSEITWCKKAPMPESVQDRPSSATEKIFLLSKKKTYFYDQDATREPHKPASIKRMEYGWSGEVNRDWPHGGWVGWNVEKMCHPAGRNMRNYLLLGPEPYKGAHFAVFPTSIPKIAISAGTSQRGVCPRCAAPWVRVTERQDGRHWTERRTPRKKWDFGTDHGRNDGGGSFLGNDSQIIGWRPTCAHYPQASLWQEYPRQDPNESNDDYAQRMEPIRLERQRLLALWEPLETVPAIVLDPFVGSGTTLVVARQLGRSGIGLDLSFDYLSQQAKARLSLDKLAEWEKGRPPFNPQELDDLPLFSMEEQ